MTVRKNQAALTAGGKRRFVAALPELEPGGRYDEFVMAHNAFIVSDTDTDSGPEDRPPFPSCPGPADSSWISSGRCSRRTRRWRWRAGTGAPDDGAV
jgi:hypothetical protein